MAERRPLAKTRIFLILSGYVGYESEARLPYCKKSQKSFDAGKGCARAALTGILVVCTLLKVASGSWYDV